MGRGRLVTLPRVGQAVPRVPRGDLIDRRRKRSRPAEWSEQRSAELPSRRDAELRVYLAQMPLDSPGAQEQSSTDLGVRGAFGRQTGDLGFLRSELLVRVDGALAHRLARGRELPAGPVRERLGAHGEERVVRGPEVLPGVDTPVLAPEPLAVEEVGASCLGADGAPVQPLDRLEVESFSGVAGDE